jgi:acylphosphatase
MAEKVKVRAVVEGRVQGVFFRYSTCEQADRLGVTGWVMNRPDGTVELTAEGPKEAVDDLIKWCHHGPPGAHVTNVRVTSLPYTGEFETFNVKHSGGHW